jgi:hypothetical protein
MESLNKSTPVINQWEDKKNKSEKQETKEINILKRQT